MTDLSKLHLNATTSSSPLTRIQSTPSPLSSSNSTSSFSSGFDSLNFDLLASRRNSEPPFEGERRQSTGSMTSWSSTEEGAVFKPPDYTRNDDTDHIINAPTPSPDSDATSPHEVTTPNSDVDTNYFASRNGNVSPASSATSTAHSKGEATPRAELPAPLWPMSVASPNNARRNTQTDPNDIDMDGSTPGDWAQAKRMDNTIRRKHASMDASSPCFSATFGVPPPSARSNNLATGGQPPSASTTAMDASRRSSESATSSSSTSQKVVAQSSTTGCCISAPISPPAHYPGSARQTGRKSSPARSAGGSSTSDSNSFSSGSSASTNTTISDDNGAPPAPRWARPPRVTNKISGRAWSFSQGQERPDIDFDPELFDTAEPDAVQEILKGSEGRIAVKTTPAEYNIMAWLPGFSIDYITISMKGDRTVQIVADLWDEGDHAQWNVLLGEDVNKSAISATFKGSELVVTVKRNPPASNRSYRSTSTSWSAPAAAQMLNSSISGALGTDPNRPNLATYPRAPQISH